MNERDRAEAVRLDALKDTGREIDGYERISARIAKNPRATISLRLSVDDLREIEAAAGGNLSEFMRTAALEKARLLARGVSDSEVSAAMVALLSGQVSRA